MQIIFGYDFDSGQYPDALHNKKATLGSVLAGPLKLIEILGTRLGLGGVEKHGAVRIGQYLNALRQLDNDKRFYSGSFKADAWSTAKQLLDLRDELVLGGWTGAPFKAPGRRLADLAAAEALFRQSGYCRCTGERLQRVLDELQPGRACGIAAIKHAEPLATLPPWCRNLFSQLQKLGVEIQPTTQAASKGSTDLERLQQAMSAGKPAASPFKGDGSICMIKAPTEWEAAEALASWLEMQEKLFPDILLVAGATGSMLDDRLHRHNLPGLGGQSRSRWRAALQVLPLVLSNLWEPFDPARLLELLALPKSPITKHYGNYFAKALCEHPGLDGPEWERAWNKVREAFRNSKFSTKKTEDDFCADLRFWLGEQRFSPETGMPAQYLLQVCLRVADWAANRGGSDEDGLLIESAALAGAVAEAVAATGMTTVPRPQLERILDSVVGQGLEHPEAYPQASAWSSVSMPGQIWGAADTVVWWNFTNPGTASRHLLWDEGELQAFTAAGIVLESSSRDRLREACGWRKPVLFARKKLILFFSESAAADNGGLHPLWDEMRHLLGIEQAEEQKLIADASALWREGKPLLAGSSMKRERQAVLTPPAAQREWPIIVQELKLPESHSVSSLETLIACPLSWSFSYIIDLAGGSIDSLPDVKRIVGTLCHRIIDTIFKEKKKWAPDAAEKRALALFDEYVPQMAAVLRHPGNELLRKRYRSATAAAVKSLVAILNEAGLSVSETEAPHEKNMPGIALLKGKIDMVLADRKNATLFMDLKWSGRSKYRREEVEKSLPLQLAAYSWLLSDSTCKFPPGGYYMLAQQELLFTACKAIAEEHIAADIDLKDIWNDAFSAFRARLKQLQDGVALAEGIADVAAQGPSGTAAGQEPKAAAEFVLETKCKWCSFGNLCGAGRQL